MSDEYGPSVEGPADTADGDRTMDLVKRYTGTVVVDVARALAVIAIGTRPDPADKISEATKTALRVTEAARLLCAVAPDQPPDYLSNQEVADLSALLEHYTPPQEGDAT